MLAYYLEYVVDEWRLLFQLWRQTKGSFRQLPVRVTLNHFSFKHPKRGNVCWEVNMAKNEKDKRKSKVVLGLFRVAPVLTQGPSLLAVSWRPHVVPPADNTTKDLSLGACHRYVTAKSHFFALMKKILGFSRWLYVYDHSQYGFAMSSIYRGVQRPFHAGC